MICASPQFQPPRLLWPGRYVGLEFEIAGNCTQQALAGAASLVTLFPGNAGS
jgi:hypothetical protein